MIAWTGLASQWSRWTSCSIISVSYCFRLLLLATLAECGRLAAFVRDSVVADFGFTNDRNTGCLVRTPNWLVAIPFERAGLCRRHSPALTNLDLSLRCPDEPSIFVKVRPAKALPSA
jgi:hypothetical protein